jgi:antitoxin component of MazEF toxin-antitoxin module
MVANEWSDVAFECHFTPISPDTMTDASARHAVTVKLHRVGGSLRVTLPADILRRLHLRADDVLIVVETDLGVLLTPYDDRIDRAVEQWDRLSRERRGELRRAARES